MLMLAGLMGLMAIGATALVGFAPEDEPEGEEDARPGSDGEGVDTGGTGTGIMDFISQDVEPAGPQLAGGGIAPTAPGLAASASQVAGSEGDSQFDTRPVEDGEAEGVQTGERVSIGTAADDRMDGTDAADVANGYGGDDAMIGGGAGDNLWGGDGADTLSGDAGDDTLHGGAGDDALHGGAGDDRIFGHGDDDTLRGGAGADLLAGGAGDDRLDGGAGDDALHGGLGDDALRGGAGRDTLFGGWGNDTISGLEDAPDGDDWGEAEVMDYLNGGGGNDVIVAGRHDIVTTGAGADTVLLGDWLNAEHQARLLDFAPEEDALTIVYDDGAGTEPQVEVAPDPENADIRNVMLNGSAIASVHNAAGLTAEDLTLVGSSLLPVPRA